MKLPNLQAYNPEHTELCERALVTAWGLLDDYQDDLVLIGGLVPRYLCLRDGTRPEASTLDVDLGMALGVQGVGYNRIVDRLETLQFKPEPDTRPQTPPLAKFFRQFSAPNLKLVIDFFTDQPTDNPSTMQLLDNMYVPAQPGVGRALTVYRKVPVEATNLFGVPTRSVVKVCEVGPLLCLKLRACGADSMERHGKDAFDIINVVQYYDKGPDAAFAAFAAERGINPAFEEALAILERKFADPAGEGCMEYADFCLGGLRMTSSPVGFDYNYRQHRETAATVADRMLRAARGGSRGTID